MTEDRTRRPRFAAIIAPLAIATRAVDVDEPTIALYYRALLDVPISLLEQAAVELAATARFFPKPAEWRAAVDEILDRRQRMKALDVGGQALLPGEVGEYLCPSCEGTSFVVADVACDKGLMCPSAAGREEHSHSRAAKCTNRYCVEARAQKAAESRRYSRVSE